MSSVRRSTSTMSSWPITKGRLPAKTRQAFVDYMKNGGGWWLSMRRQRLSAMAEWNEMIGFGGWAAAMKNPAHDLVADGKIVLTTPRFRRAHGDRRTAGDHSRPEHPITKACRPMDALL